MKPYPTYAEVITAMGRSGRTVEFMQALIEKACDIDRERRALPETEWTNPEPNDPPGYIIGKNDRN